MSASVLDLEEAKTSFERKLSATGQRVIVCAGTGCVANGSVKVFEALRSEIAAKGLDVVVELRDENPGRAVFISKSGCQGFCQKGPLVTVLPDGILYTRVAAADVPEIVKTTLVEKGVVARLLYTDPRTKEKCRGTDDIPFYKRQRRFVLKDCGVIDPENIHEYIGRGGYAMARRAMIDQQPEAICAEIIASGLRGRGGGGFPTGRKWDVCRLQSGADKYIICNGDEGDPGAFMDRSVMEGNPHSVLEGMLIAARAIGANRGVVYVRTEYPLAVRRMRKAVEDATAMGILGDNVFGSGNRVTMTVMEGAGAFVCGEETALMRSVEGKRGMPTPKPPFPAQRGLNGKPTVINNVETLATIPLIMAMGAGEFRKMGTANSPGTKTFALTGHVVNSGLIEVPFGTTLREIINEIAGGVTDDQGRIDENGFKAVQIGGPSGGCLTREHLDLPMDFDSLRKAGAMVGSGGLVVMNSGTCMVGVASFFMKFTQTESCGKCVLCREGTKQMLALMEDICAGRSQSGSIDLMEKLAVAVQKGSLCGLGKTAPNPVLSTLRQFRAEYDAHVADRNCPAGRCKDLVEFTIEPSLCKGCSLCARKCPVSAITGEKAKPYVIHQETCIRCGSCVDLCRFGAIKGGRS